MTICGCCVIFYIRWGGLGASKKKLGIAPQRGETGEEKMKEFKIRRSKDNIMIISAGGEDIAEYRLTPGVEKKEMAQMRYTLNKHLAEGGTLGNYEF